jgi:hypothetical protein
VGAIVVMPVAVIAIRQIVHVSITAGMLITLLSVRS